MRTRGMVSVLLAGTLVVVLAAGAALATQAEDETAGKGSARAQNSEDDSAEDQALEFEGRPTPVNGYVDLGQQGASSGDDFVFSDELYRTGGSEGEGQDSSSEKVGQADGRCTLIDPSAERFICTVVTSLENGSIVTEGVLTNDQGSPTTASVTGGTGEYRGVGGEATLDLTPPEGPHAVRFDLQQRDGGGAASQPEPQTTGQQKEESQGGADVKAKPSDAKSDNANVSSADETQGKTREQ